MRTSGHEDALSEKPACWRWHVSPKVRNWVTRHEASRASQPAWYTEADWREEALYVGICSWQKCRCAICGRSTRGRRETVSRLVVDHDHGTGLIRGFLCLGCNAAEGRHNVKRRLYSNYRLRNPASILELEIPYTSSWAKVGDSADETRRRSAHLHDVRDRIHRLRSAGESVPDHLVDELMKIATANVRAMR
ncbi:endonuclease domain-containing protein [Streptomyces sp. M10]|uniref:endonuclease domain-containing protein n=1 Tax=Streptomyces sp. M10 TaxID=412968 RepID=UPI000D145BFC